MRHRSRSSCGWVWAATFGLAVSPAGAAIYNVGIGSGCETSTLEAAVAMAGFTPADDEIRLDSDLLLQPVDTILLDSWDSATQGTLWIRGGYTSCTDTTADPALTAQIDLLLADPGIRIRNPGSGVTEVRLENLDLYNSNGTALAVEWNAEVELYNVLLSVNAVSGLYVAVGASAYLDPQTIVAYNGVGGGGGGGVRCVNTGSVVETEAWIHGNESDGDGGGVSANGCEVVFGEMALVEENLAGGDGGGVHAQGQALVSFFEGARVKLNEAAGYGGGIAATGAGTQVIVAGARIDSNRTASGGGGIYATTGAFVGTGGASCDGSFCPTSIDQNQLLAGVRNGAAVMVTDDAIAQIKQARVIGNVVPEPEGFGSVFYAATGGELRTESVRVFGNLGANRVFQVASGGNLRVAFTTAARNRYLDAEAQPVEAFAIWAGGTGTVAKALSSIFHPTAGYFVEGQVDEQFDCLITETTLGLPGSASFAFVVDPAYNDLVAGDLRMSGNSPAVDFCDTVFFTPTVGGIDGRPRGYDVPGNPQGNPGPGGGLQDVGAYELGSLFVDGFASGTTGAWSDSVP